MTYGAIQTDQINNIKNMLKVFDLSTMAYYNFHSDNKRLAKDAFRSQGLKIIHSNGNSNDQSITYTKANEINFFCDTLDHQIPAGMPYFSGFVSKMIPLALMTEEKTNFDYTVSMWLWNDGN